MTELDIRFRNIVLFYFTKTIEIVRNNIVNSEKPFFVLNILTVVFLIHFLRFPLLLFYIFIKNVEFVM